ncbi:MAG: PilZ domain-containing protein [Xanthomonadales bacterium]|jgi:hypothetical protein|nr:PilZ domain-containing protein [Xanthomonadales bacterium]MCB1605022.1 PilZ domain-containing protein [Xanthomonadales bacterium]
MSKEYRKNKRVKPVVEILLINTLTEKGMGEVLNVSCDGVLLNCKNGIEPGEMFQTLWKFDSKDYHDIVVGLECMWTESHREDFNFCGLHVIDISDEDQAQLEKLIHLSPHEV